MKESKTPAGKPILRDRLLALAEANGTNIGVLAFFAIVTAYMIGNVVFSGDVTADVGFDDRLFDARLMRYEFDWLMGRTDGGLFDIDFFFPHPNALATTDPEFGLMLVTLPFRIFTDDYLLLSNLAAYISFVLVGHAAFLLTRELTGSRGAALFAAVAFAFCQYRFHQIDHSQILQMQWLTYALYSLHRLAKSPGPRWGIAVGVFVFLHGVSSLSIGLYSMPLVPIVALWVAFTAEPGKRQKMLAWAAGAGGVAAFALFPFYRPLLINREIFAIVRDLGEVRMYSGRLEQLWAVPPYNRYYGPTWSAEMGRESMTYPGLLVLVFAALGLVARPQIAALATDRREKWAKIGLEFIVAVGKFCAIAGVILLCVRWPKFWWVIFGALIAYQMQRNWKPAPTEKPHRGTPVIWVYAAAGLLYLLIAFGPEIVYRGQQIGTGLWEYVTGVPGYAQVRTPARFYFVTSLAFSVLAAAGASFLLKQIGSTVARRGVVGALVAGVLFEMWVHIPERRMVNASKAPRIYTWLKEQPGNRAIVELPIMEARERYRMYFANIHKRPTVGAESSFHLPALAWMTPHGLLSNPNQGLVNLAKMRTAGLEFLLLHVNEGPPQWMDGHRQLMSAAGATLFTNVDGVEVWRFPEAPLIAPFTAENVSARLFIPQAVAEGQPLTISVELTPKSLPIFERRYKKLYVKVTGLPTGTGKERFAVHFAPPLLLAGRSEQFPVVVPDARGKGPHTVKFELVDQDDKSWAVQDATIDVR